MLKNMKKSKILFSFIAIALVAILFGNIYSLAADGDSGTVKITAPANNTVSNTNTNTNISATNTNAVTNITSTTSGTTNSTVNTSNVNNTTNNTSVYNNTSNSTKNTSKLPYTGTNSTSILLIVVFIASSVYAYKKVSDYNL